MKHKILIIEDDEKIQILMRRYLIAKGYCVLMARNANAAYSIFESKKPNLIFLSLSMKGTDGLAMIDRIKAECNVPVIVLSDEVDRPKAIECLDKGADDFVVKPFSVSEMLLRVNLSFRRYS